MTIPARDSEAPAEEMHTPEQEAAVRAAGVWIHQFARTLKTCRLYDGSNPTVVRFRAELVATLHKVLSQHGVLRYRFSSDDVFCEDESLYPARSRDDNLALVFFRDGVRGIALLPGIEVREVDVLLDAVLQVSGQNFGEDDLVTLLWEAALPHVEVDYVPGEGDMGSSGGQIATAEDGGPVLPWPTGGGLEEEAGTQVEGAAEEGALRGGRSDDWTAGDLTVEIEAGFEELESLAPGEVVRFRREFEAEHGVGLITATVATSRAYLAAGAGPDDRADLARFLPRVLRGAISHGHWLEARATLFLLRECGTGEWSVDGFVQELLQPISVSSTIERLDRQEDEPVLDFLAFARELGDPAIDWLCLLLAESQNRRNRRLVAEAIATLCRDRPERLAPWISDPRWFVVRNIVHILGWLAGPKILPLLQVAMRNPDPRVRLEVVAALGRVDSKLARPLLLRMLDGADTRLFCLVLHQLSGSRDPGLARLLLGMMQDPAFEARPQEERHAVYSALAASGGEEIVAELENELYRGNWFSRGAEVHRQAVARILARVGTPSARLVLERGVESKRGPVRKACEDAIGGFRDAA